MIFYLTFNDQPSGVYSSQVIDVISFVNENLKTKVRLIAFISIRDFWKNKRKIKQYSPNAIILPMFPGVHRWRKNAFIFNFICKIYKPKIVVGRSVLATQLALLAKKAGAVNNVVYDGRGAIEAEWKEYKVITNEKMLNTIHQWEQICINHSDFRIAVSNKLVEHWQTNFDYNMLSHVVIPCTINQYFERVTICEKEIKNTRNRLSISDTDIVLAYSGSLAGWQSFNLLEAFLDKILNSQSNFKVLFLSQKDESIAKLEHKFPEQIITKYVKPTDVASYLVAADYGLLIRESSVTNAVASPVKFAEYLACGLQVIISEGIGDYTEFVEKNNCGTLINRAKTNKVAIHEKRRLNELALNTFCKKMYTSSYDKVYLS